MMNDSCQQYRRLIPRDLLGDLDAASREGLEEHLGNCPACCRQRQAMSFTVEELGAHVDTPVPRHFLLPESIRLSRSRWGRLAFWGDFSCSWAWAPAFLLVMAALLLWMKPWEQSSSAGAAVLTTADLEIFRLSLFQKLEERSRVEKEEWLATLQAEMKGLSKTLDERQRRQLRSAMVRMEERVGQRLQASELRQRVENSRSTLQIVEWLQNQQNSIVQLSDQIHKVAQSDKQRGDETDQLFAVLIKSRSSDQP